MRTQKLPTSAIVALLNARAGRRLELPNVCRYLAVYHRAIVTRKTMIIAPATIKSDATTTAATSVPNAYPFPGAIDSNVATLSEL
ncbi:hypothetical protein [Agromyces albus]|uniref:Uncharacterized protein n=1 Tax=Agromyces albus TaxID=205332 RepID=A0A4Q2L4X7_9MICO|nr:hypothetical protein [Agromyces albus]RXZ73285.1 hypothetical protein ESP51_00870 [Agromyces albus]